MTKPWRALLAVAAAIIAVAAIVVAPAKSADACTTSCANISSDPVTLAKQIKSFADRGAFSATASAASTYNDIYNAEILPIISGTVQAGCEVDFRVLQTLVIVLNEYGSARLSELNRKCPGITPDPTCASNPSSAHCANPSLAIDFLQVGSTGLTGNDGSIPFLRFLDTFVPSGTTAGQVQCKSATTFTYIRQITDSCSHQHVDFGSTNGRNLRINTSTVATASTIVNLGADGTVYAKTGLTGSWVTEINNQADIDVSIDGAGNPVIATLDPSGTVRTKGGLAGYWTVQIGNVTNMSIGGTTLAVVRTDGTLQAKDGLQSTWTTLGGGVKSVSVASDPVHGSTITALYTDGTVRAKTGIQGPWVDLIGNAVQIDTASDTKNGTTWTVLGGDGVVRAKTGMNATWIAETSPAISTRVASDPQNGVVLTAILNGGGHFAKTGLTAPWVRILDGVSVSDVASSASSGPTFVANTGDTLWGKTGLNATWSRLGSTKKVVIAN